MIRARISMPNSEDIVRMLDVMAHPDFTPLAERVREIMIEDNREGLLRGEDCFGDQMAPVEQSTIDRGRGGDGEPLNPQGAASRAIADYQVEIQQGFDRVLLVGSWPNTPFIHFHVHGTKYMVARDPTGIRPAGEALIAEALEEFIFSVLARAS